MSKHITKKNIDISVLTIIHGVNQNISVHVATTSVIHTTVCQSVTFNCRKLLRQV